MLLRIGVLVIRGNLLKTNGLDFIPGDDNLYNLNDAVISPYFILRFLGICSAYRPSRRSFV